MADEEDVVVKDSSANQVLQCGDEHETEAEKSENFRCVGCIQEENQVNASESTPDGEVSEHLKRDNYEAMAFDNTGSGATKDEHTPGDSEFLFRPREESDAYEVITNSEVSSLDDWEGVQKSCLSEIPPIDPGILHDLESKAKEVSNNLDLMLGNLSNSMRAMTVVTDQHLHAYDSSVKHLSETVDSSIKTMYTLIAHCEQVDSRMAPIYKMAAQIKEIKRTLDILEGVCK